MRIVSRKSLVERVAVSGGCWIWTAARSKEGYNVLRTEAGQRTASRLFWGSFVGPIPGGYNVRSRKLPTCVGKACCNLEHHRLLGPVEETALTTCKAGHLLTPDNVVLENRNGRPFKRFRICRWEAWKGWQKQHSSLAKAGKKQSK
jgi:hypothetical protein